MSAARHISTRHVPVMAREVVDALQPRAGGRYLDGTFGAGGYTTAMLDRADCQVIAIDRDPDAIAAGQALAERYAPRLRLIEGRFGDMAELLQAEGVDEVDGVALDLGVSSMQFDQADRGFSFRASGPLDMRMEKSGASAADLVNESEEGELADIIWRYGEERRSRRVARAIVEARRTKRIDTTGELAEIVRRAVGPQGRDESDPATRTFQALRIAVNDELGELERGLAAAEQVLAPGGRLAVVSFHSLEDRAVKEFVRARAGRTPGPSRHAPPSTAGHATTLRDLSRKPVLPSEAEVAANPRARSARLRVAEKLGPREGSSGNSSGGRA
ncbi:MAG: 16S rRNA (cytosine(1402)-N(4))-methyltransferase RsmH [Alphaproteobacteria bacterium]|nr:16S rRNA (cytosine(1402)-N(4))-methyltransferase RsmH [Alphaproteobacteria bacterium]